MDLYSCAIITIFFGCALAYPPWLQRQTPQGQMSPNFQPQGPPNFQPQGFPNFQQYGPPNFQPQGRPSFPPSYFPANNNPFGQGTQFPQEPRWPQPHQTPEGGPFSFDFANVYHGQQGRPVMPNLPGILPIAPVAFPNSTAASGGAAQDNADKGHSNFLPGADANTDNNAL